MLTLMVSAFSFAQTEDKVDYYRFTEGGETFVLLVSEDHDCVDLAGMTISHQWSYVLNGSDLEVKVGDNVVYTYANFPGAAAFGQNLNSLTKIDLTNYSTVTASGGGADSYEYSFN